MHKSSNSSFEPRTTAQISSSVEKKLLGYAAAAGVANLAAARDKAASDLSKVAEARALVE